MDEFVCRYILALNKLTFNDGPLINELTEIAREAKATEAVHVIAHKTYKRVMSSQPSQKLVYLYVMDSIVKNVGQPYVTIFGKNLVHVFERAFLSMENEEGRSKMYKLRVTWKPIFPNTTMCLLDTLIRRIDPKWPLVAKPSNNNNNDPVSSKKTTYIKPSTSTPSSSSRMEIDSLEPPCIMVKVATKKTKPLTTAPQPPPPPPEPTTSVPPASIPPSKQTQPVSAPMSTPTNLRDPRMQRQVVPKDPRIEANSSTLKRKSSGTTLEQLPSNKTIRITRNEEAPMVRVPSVPMVNPRLPPPTHPPPSLSCNWRVEIDGYDYPDIGVDPRLLNLVPQPRRSTFIRILGKRYTLHLERIHPLITLNASFHAVRFRTQPVPVLLNERLFVLPPAGHCIVTIENRPYVACLGAPVHELIIDGRPHNVPFNNTLTYINVDGHQVSARFPEPGPKIVDILAPIPPTVLQFAAANLFGSARYLQRSPTNPLEMLRMERRRQGSGTGGGGGVSQEKVEWMQPEVEEEVVPSSTQEPQQYRTDYPAPTAAPVQQVQSQPTNTANLSTIYQQLVRSGIIQQNSVTPEEINLRHFSLSLFKKANHTEIHSLYEGFQCVQCGQRFADAAAEEYKTHLDYHFFKNSMDCSGARQRHFYPEVQVWLLGNNSALLHDRTGTGVAEDGDEDVSGPGEEHTHHHHRQQDFRCKAFPEAALNICAVCKEGFGDQMWDDDEDDWMLVNAVRDGDQLFHPVCKDDAGKEMREDGTRDRYEDKVDPDNLPAVEVPDRTVRPRLDHSEITPETGADGSPNELDVKPKLESLVVNGTEEDGTGGATNWEIVPLEKEES